MSTFEERLAFLKLRFRERFGNINGIHVVVSPLRICPLGAHIDHQEGKVTGMTLNESILLAFSPREDNKVILESMNFSGRSEFEIGTADIPPSEFEWEKYARKAAVALADKGYELKRGFVGLIEGRLPIGGLSSSAAGGVAYLLAFEDTNKLTVSPIENIELDKMIENKYLGLKNGILDQSTVLLSEENKLTFMDCDDVSFEKIASENPMNFEIVVVYSGLSQSLISSNDYNNRVSECQEAARFLLQKANMAVPETPKLRMVPAEVWEKYQNEVPEIPQKRARHFFTEMERVEKGVLAWKNGDVKAFGVLMNESGQSSIENYESGCPHLTTLYHILRDCEGVYGARFSGAGFRGSCIGLVNPEYKEAIRERVRAEYPKAHPDMAEIFTVHFCKTNGNARVIPSINGNH